VRTLTGGEAGQGTPCKAGAVETGRPPASLPVSAAEKRRLEARCRICGFTKDRLRHPEPKNGWLTMHHLIPRLQRGRSHVNNLVPLCFRCHKIMDSNKPPNLHERERLRRILRVNLTPEEIDYVNLMMGRGYIDRHYPLDFQQSATSESRGVQSSYNLGEKAGLA
jgi:hypothetical protein